MIRSLYVIGGAGTGKSTFMQEVLRNIGAELGPLEELYEINYNRKGGLQCRVRLRGQRFDGGVYLGLMRDEFPGTDALDNACGPVAREWLAEGDLPSLIVGEGMLLGSQGFQVCLASHTDLMLVHLVLPEERRLELVSARGHEFNATWSAQTVTRARKTAELVEATTGATVITAQYIGGDSKALDLATLHAMGL